MSSLLTRRDLFAGWLAAPLAASLHARTVTQDWLLGTWQSDLKRTIDEFRFSDGRHPPDDQTKRRMADVFGEMSYLVTDTHFTVHSTRSSTGSEKTSRRYSVKRSSDTSITVQFTTFQLPAASPLVLFRESEDTLFTESGQNREFFNRVRS
jgi:hypothetical protein